MTCRSLLVSIQSSFYAFDFLSDLISTSSEWKDLRVKSIQLILLYVLKCTDNLKQEEAQAESVVIIQSRAVP